LNQKGEKMKKQTLVSIIIFMTMMIGTVGNVFSVRADEIVTTDAIAGTWYGNMHFSEANPVQRIKLSIPAGCEPGSACGTLLNYSVQCTWEITYDGFSNGAYQYHFSSTLRGSCPAGSAGSLTLLSDGSLYRVHTTPMFTATGTLTQLPNTGK
jgi:hypothetical protein